jgi:hypothetical protein
MLKFGKEFHDLGGDYYNKFNSEKKIAMYLILQSHFFMDNSLFPKHQEVSISWLILLFAWETNASRDDFR